MASTFDGGKMEAEIYLHAQTKARSGSFVLSCQSGHGDMVIRFIGSSITASANPIEQVTSLTFTIQEGQQGVIALVMVVGGKYAVKRGFFIPVSWEEGAEKPKINLKDPFVSPSDCLGQIVGDCYMRVRTPSKTFSSDYHESAGVSQVLDSNLLCRFMAGDVKEEDVVAAAMAAEEEVSAKQQLVVAREGLRSAQMTIEALSSDLRRLTMEVNAFFRSRQRLLKGIDRKLFITRRGIKRLVEQDYIKYKEDYT